MKEHIFSETLPAHTRDYHNDKDRRNEQNMAINPMQILKIRDTLNAFRNRHPGFSHFIGDIRRRGLPEGTVMDMTVTMPDGKTMKTNFRVSQEDLDLIRMLGELSRQK